MDVLKRHQDAIMSRYMTGINGSRGSIIIPEMFLRSAVDDLRTLDSFGAVDLLLDGGE
jgi:hypothetical protein